MEEATWNLLDKGEKIAQEATVLKEELIGALEEVRKESEYSGPAQEQTTPDVSYRIRFECCVLVDLSLVSLL